MTATARLVRSIANTSAISDFLDQEPVFRRKVGLSAPLHLGPTAANVVKIFEEVIRSGKSEGVLLWPNRPDGIAIFHALASLNRIEDCDTKGFATLYFPWSQNVGATQRTLLADRDILVRATLPALSRIYANRDERAYPFLMALHSLKHIGASGKSEKRLKRALERDPLLIHPALYEITPQVGIVGGAVRDYGGQFLRRLHRHTWISDCSDHLEALGDPRKAPFFMFGVHADAVRIPLWRDGGLDPKHDGRRPDMILLDLTRRARNRLGGGSWRQKVAKFCAVAGDIYGAAAPPIFALTEDVFVLQALRWEILKQYDVRRTAASENRAPASTRVVLSASSDLLSTDTINSGPAPRVSVEA